MEHHHHRRHGDDAEDQGRSSQHPRPSVVHVSHEREDGENRHGHGHGHGSSAVIHGHKHEVPRVEEMAGKATVKMYCKVDREYVAAIRDGKVILARADPRDPSQEWYKDEKYSTRVKDSEGYPSFSLINKLTNEAIKHSFAASDPVQLTPYNANSMDESILWTQSRDLGDGFKAIRMVNNTALNLDAFHGDEGVHDGTLLVLWAWNNGDNQKWIISPNF